MNMGIRGNDSRTYEGNVKWIMREERGVTCIFISFSSLGIGEAGPAKDTTAFGLSFLFFSMSCICTIRGRHRPPPQRNTRKAVVVFLLALHMHRGVVLV